MAITIDLAPEVQAELARQAAAQGCALEAYAASLLEEAAHAPASSVQPAAPPAKDIVALFAPLRGLNLDFGRNPSTGRAVDL